MSTAVLSEAEERIGWITLNRPEALNAITIELARELDEALWTLARTCRVIVIRGAGGNFCVGGDFAALQQLQARGTEAMRELFESFHRACATIAELPVPVITAVEGYAMAGGFELMQAADIALVREDAKLGDNHSNFGQVPGGGSSQRLPRLVGRQRALALILSGDRLTGAEAVAWGLAYRAYAPDQFDAQVTAFAQRLADKSPEALARSKRLVYEGLTRPLAEGIELETDTVLEHLSGASATAGIERFTGRRGT
ncbi:MAG TPA: enoyl-CoA hydratase/isomerase family protein [Solirubrobacteraceae bacterium]|nr:enoyl-CoA hydratase/isomerase family protein [Solirubrobacteraceae bacterium]